MENSRRMKATDLKGALKMEKTTSHHGIRECLEHDSPEPGQRLKGNDFLSKSDTFWWSDHGIRSLNLRLLAVFISPLMIGYDGTLIASLLTMPHCKLRYTNYLHKMRSVDHTQGSKVGELGR